MGYVLVHGLCVVCKEVFSYSPTKVPSVVVQGERRAVCEPCVVQANRIREAKGLPLFEILPGAYQPDDEDEVPW